MERQPVELIVYGDFNCPFSALASARASRLEQLGVARVDWRAVEHAPDIPPAGTSVSGELAADLERELEQIRGLLGTDEPDRLALPTRLPNTGRATAAFAATPVPGRPAMRSRLFAAHWSDDLNLSDDTTLSQLGSTATDAATAARWRDEWIALTRPIVPVMVLPDGYVSRGLGALARLAKLMDEAADAGRPSPDRSDLGGESPCFAHLLDERPD